MRALARARTLGRACDDISSNGNKNRDSKGRWLSRSFRGLYQEMYQVICMGVHADVCSDVCADVCTRTRNTNTSTHIRRHARTHIKPTDGLGRHMHAVADQHVSVRVAGRVHCQRWRLVMGRTFCQLRIRKYERI